MSEPLQFTQPQMEETLRKLSGTVPKIYPDTINAWMHPVFQSCDAEKGTYTCSFEIKPAYANPMGTLHGGLIGLVFDTAMGHLTHFFSNQIPPTISMNVSYLRPVPVDRPVFVQAHMDRLGATVGYTSAVAFTADAPERILATATGSYLVAARK